MPRTILLSVALAVGLAGAAVAGDTVTINLPGGATQTVSAGVLAGAIGAVGGIPSGGVTGDTVIASVTQDASTGDITFTTVGGAVFTVSSAFIARLLLTYL